MGEAGRVKAVILVHIAGLLSQAQEMRIPVGDRFVSRLHPIKGDLSRWGYRAGQCPVAEQVCREAINLFTDYALSRRQLEALFSDL